MPLTVAATAASRIADEALYIVIEESVLATLEDDRNHENEFESWLSREGEDAEAAVRQLFFSVVRSTGRFFEVQDGRVEGGWGEIAASDELGGIVSIRIDAWQIGWRLLSRVDAPLIWVSRKGK